MDIKELAEYIKTKKNIIITTHINPDADGIGASLALMFALDSLSRKDGIERRIRVVVDDKVPQNMKFLEGIEFVENYSNCYTNLKGDLIISLDSATAERLGKVQELLPWFEVINIDHHVSNTKFGKINYVDSSSASTCEIIFDIIKSMGIDFDKKISEFIYSGIVNDTGNFHHDNVTPNTFKKVSELIEAGADNNKIVTELRVNKSYAAMRLLGKALISGKIYNEKNLIVSVITQEDFKEYSGSKFDTEGVVEELLALETVDTSLFLREEETGGFKGSLRTKSDKLDLNLIAGIYNGGGHKKAAGFTAFDTPENITKTILEHI